VGQPPQSKKMECATCLTQAEVVVIGVALVVGWCGAAFFAARLSNEQDEKERIGLALLKLAKFAHHLSAKR